MHEKPCFSDKVIMILVDGEIVNDGETLNWGEGLDRKPAAILSLKLFACNQVARLDPVG